jgi:hypothetical protein
MAAAAMALGAVASAVPTGAGAQYYGGYMNQPRAYAPAYAPPPVFAAPPVYRPRVTVTPPYGYRSGAPVNYGPLGDPTTRDALATCSYC